MSTVLNENPQKRLLRFRKKRSSPGKIFSFTGNSIVDLEYLLESFKKQIKESDRLASARHYMGDVKRFFEWFTQITGEFDIRAVTPLDLVDYREYLQKKGGRKKQGAKPATVNRALISLRICFNWLVDEGMVYENPVKRIKPVTVDRKLAPQWLSRNEQAALLRILKKASNPRDVAIIRLMLDAGLRVGEVCSLNRSDIEISERKGKVIVRSGKGNKYREVPLNRDIRKILQDWLKRSNPKSPWLFPNRYGKGISTRGVFKLVKEYAYQAKLPPETTPHTFRHTFCKNALNQRATLDQVAAMAGHSTLDVTKIYVASSQEELQAVVERMVWE